MAFLLNRSKKTPVEVDHIKAFMERDLSHFKWLIKYKLETIIDVGANQGQFVFQIRKFFPITPIHSFEPLPEVYEQLKTNFPQDNNLIAVNCALGSSEGTLTMYQNAFTPSSSFLRLEETHKQLFDYASIETPVEIKITTLDKYFSEDILKAPILIKIDVQGFEEQVIQGGRNVISDALLLIIEVSFKALYHDQSTFDRIYETLKGMGYKYIGNFDQLLSPVDGEILQADAIFLNSKFTV